MRVSVVPRNQMERGLRYATSSRWPANSEGSVVSGAGDDVFYVNEPDLADIVCGACDGNFVVHGYSTTQISLMVNTIGAFDRVVVVPHGSGDEDFAISAVQADAEWTYTA